MTMESQLISIGIIRAGNCVFVQKREGTGHLDGFHEFPGGKVQSGESPSEAARREVLEETRVDLTGARRRRLHVERFSYPDRRLELHFFLFELEQKPEMPGGKWLDLAGLDERVFPPANREVIRKLKKSAR